MYPDSFTLCTMKCFTFDGFGEKEYPVKANEIPCTIGLLIPSEVFYKEQFFCSSSFDVQTNSDWNFWLCINPARGSIPDAGQVVSDWPVVLN